MANKEDWMGRVGAEWARHEAALDRLLGPAAVEGLSTLSARPGECVMDLGCGSGASTKALSTAVGADGRVLGVDISPDLIEMARVRLADCSNVSFEMQDAQVADLGRHGFDALFSRFGSMFFDDPVVALSNIHSAIRPGGRAVFVAWREPSRNQWASVPMTFVQEGTTSGASGPGPFSWADTQVYRSVLEGAGFRDVQGKPHEFMAEIGLGDDPDPVTRAAAFMMRIGPMAARLRGASESAKREAESFLKRRLTRHVKDGAVRLLASAWIVEAHT